MNLVFNLGRAFGDAALEHTRHGEANGGFDVALLKQLARADIQDQGGAWGGNEQIVNVRWGETTKTTRRWSGNGNMREGEGEGVNFSWVGRDSDEI